MDNAEQSTGSAGDQPGDQSSDTSGDNPDSPSGEPPSASPSATQIIIDLLDPGNLLTNTVRASVSSACERVLSIVTDRFGCAGEVRVKVVDDDEMAASHERWSGVAGTTDVLTFDLSSPGGGLDVDLLVCIDEAARRSSERGHDLSRELVLYVLHGVLHCLGHDDHDERGYAAMHAVEDEILTQAGLGAVFSSGEAAR